MNAVNELVLSLREHQRFWLPLTVESSNVSTAVSLLVGVKPVFTWQFPVALRNGS